MRAHVVALLPALLETLSVIEDPALNYLQMHSESAGIAEGALEAARLTVMRSSDATVAIDACLRSRVAAAGARSPSNSPSPIPTRYSSSNCAPNPAKPGSIAIH